MEENNHLDCQGAYMDIAIGLRIYKYGLSQISDSKITYCILWCYIRLGMFGYY